MDGNYDDQDRHSVATKGNELFRTHEMYRINTILLFIIKIKV